MLQVLIHLIYQLKSNFFALRTQVGKLKTNRLLSVPTGLSKLKTKLNKLGVDNLKTVPIDLKKKQLCIE